MLVLCGNRVERLRALQFPEPFRRADLCLLVLDLTSGVTSQDKAIAGLIQKAEKPCLIVLNKWDLVKPKRAAKTVREQIISNTREGLFFLQYAPLLIASALTGENVQRLFRMIGQIRRAVQRFGKDSVLVTVGFVDLVNYTALARDSSPTELLEMLERFEEAAFDAVAENGGGNQRRDGRTLIRAERAVFGLTFGGQEGDGAIDHLLICFGCVVFFARAEQLQIAPLQGVQTRLHAAIL